MAKTTTELLCVLSGFGGQGVLFAGKVLANCGLIDGRHVSWMPSYGPEMRGGTANCSVSLSVEPIGSPFITKPTAVIAMNQPSVEKFGPTIVFPATKIAEDEGLKGLANIICLGKLWAETGFCEHDVLTAAIEKCVPPKKKHLLEPNLRAIELGINL